MIVLLNHCWIFEFLFHLDYPAYFPMCIGPIGTMLCNQTCLSHTWYIFGCVLVHVRMGCQYNLCFLNIWFWLRRHKIVIVEGNYLFLEEGMWQDICSIFDEKWYACPENCEMDEYHIHINCINKLMNQSFQFVIFLFLLETLQIGTMGADIRTTEHTS